jgi:hypothetical protein
MSSTTSGSNRRGVVNKTKVRIVPVLKKGKGHEGHVDGYIVHPEDRAVREAPIQRARPALLRKQRDKDLL